MPSFPRRERSSSDGSGVEQSETETDQSMMIKVERQVYSRKGNSARVRERGKKRGQRRDGEGEVEEEDKQEVVARVREEMKNESWMVGSKRAKGTEKRRKRRMGLYTKDSSSFLIVEVST